MKIVFAHNVYDRLKTLKNTILIEKELYPNARVSIAYNDIFVNIFQDITNFSAISFNEKPHKIGCVNGCILSIQQVLNDDFNVLIFSHDDVYINKEHINVFNEHIENIISGKYDVICRMPSGFGDNYYMMEAFFMSKKVAFDIFSSLSPIKNENEIPNDFRGSISPEVWLFNIFNKSDLKTNIINYDINNIHYNQLLGQQMGFVHLNAGLRGWSD